jgi:hypothetical protein
MMHLFLVGLALLILAFVMHVIIWRVQPPKRSIRALLGIFAATPLVTVSIFVAIEPSSAIIGASLSGALRVLLFYVSCSLVYVCLYSAIEAQSPSLAIVSYVAGCGSAGCSETEIGNHIIDRESVSARIDSMTAAKMIVVGDGRCALTPGGRLWAEVFEFAGNIFRLPLGG